MFFLWQVRSLNMIEPHAPRVSQSFAPMSSNLAEPDRVLAIARLRVLLAPDTYSAR